ncbi:MAG: recombinase family protein [Acidimicrobiales bacterium]
MAQILSVFAELERRLIGERTKAALAVKRDQGVVLGRPRVLPSNIPSSSITAAGIRGSHRPEMAVPAADPRREARGSYGTIGHRDPGARWGNDR